MDSSHTVQSLIDKIQTDWSTWKSCYSHVTSVKFDGPRISDDWSLKDIIAHITWHEREMVDLIKAHALVGSELWNLPTDERNAAIFKLVRDQPLEQVLAESEQVHQHLLEALPTLSNQDLTDPSSFPNMPPDWQPWMIIAQNTYEHYEDHMRDVQKWLEKGDSSLRSE